MLGILFELTTKTRFSKSYNLPMQRHSLLRTMQQWTQTNDFPNNPTIYQSKRICFYAQCSNGPKWMTVPIIPQFTNANTFTFTHNAAKDPNWWPSQKTHKIPINRALEPKKVQNLGLQDGSGIQNRMMMYMSTSTQWKRTHVHAFLCIPDKGL